MTWYNKVCLGTMALVVLRRSRGTSSTSVECAAQFASIPASPWNKETLA